MLKMSTLDCTLKVMLKMNKQNKANFIETSLEAS